MKKIHIIGIGMGNPEHLSALGKKRIEESEALIGAKRMLSAFCEATDEGKLTYESIVPQDILSWIEEHEELTTVAVLMSGDVGFFSGAKKLSQLIFLKNQEQQEEQSKEPLYEVELVCGISSLQYFCAKLFIPWEDAKIVSLHGRDCNVAGLVQTHKKTFFLTGSAHSATEICRLLTEEGLGDATVYVGEKLSYEEERITQATAKELCDREFDSLSVVLVENQRLVGRESVSYGFEDWEFVRGKVPMTKMEVRSVSLSKLRLKKDDVVYDIGGGTGSVSVELSLLAAQGQVYSVELSPEALGLMKENKEAFGAHNLHIIEGKAPEALEALPPPDKAFIGGTKGNLQEILKALLKKNPEVRVVINAIALESVGEALKCLKKLNFDEIDLVQITSSRAKEVGSYHMMLGQNPVYIISGQGSTAV